VPIVEASIDGHAPMRFILDSGASFLAIDRRAAASLELEFLDLTKDGGRAPSLDAGEGRFDVRDGARVREIHAGPFVGRDVAALVLDLSPVEQACGVRVDGVLPASMFRGGLLTLDRGRGDVTFVAGSLPAADGEDVLALERDDRAYVAAAVDGKPCRFLIDTGSEDFVSVPQSLTGGLRFRVPPTVVGRYLTMAGVSLQRKGRLDGALTWGRRSIADPIVALSAADYGKVGIEFLRDFRTTFDFSGARVRFERTTEAPIVSRPVRSPGAGFLRGDGGWVVRYVLDDGSAAAAGVREDDRVELIDGRPSSSVGLLAYQEMLASQERITLRVVRDGVARDVVLTVRTLVE